MPGLRPCTSTFCCYGDALTLRLFGEMNSALCTDCERDFDLLDRDVDLSDRDFDLDFDLDRDDF